MKNREWCYDSDMGQGEKISSCVSTEPHFRGELTGSSGHSWTTQTFHHLPVETWMGEPQKTIKSLCNALHCLVLENSWKFFFIVCPFLDLGLRVRR